MSLVSGFVQFASYYFGGLLRVDCYVVRGLS